MGTRVGTLLSRGLRLGPGAIPLSHRAGMGWALCGVTVCPLRRCPSQWLPQSDAQGSGLPRCAERPAAAAHQAEQAHQGVERLSASPRSRLANGRVMVSGARAVDVVPTAPTSGLPPFGTWVGREPVPRRGCIRRNAPGAAPLLLDTPCGRILCVGKSYHKHKERTHDTPL